MEPWRYWRVRLVTPHLGGPAYTRRSCVGARRRSIQAGSREQLTDEQVSTTHTQNGKKKGENERQAIKQSKKKKKVRWAALMEVRPDQTRTEQEQEQETRPTAPCECSGRPVAQPLTTSPSTSPPARGFHQLDSSAPLQTLKTLNHKRPAQQIFSHRPSHITEAHPGRQLVRSRASSRRPSAQPQLLKHPTPVCI